MAGERCSLFFSGQPPFCRTCYKYGHEKGDCKLKRCCRQCGDDSHVSKDCSQPRKCDLCDTPGHLARDCPERVKAGCRIFSFADAVRGGFSGRSRGPEIAPEVQAAADAWKAQAEAKKEALKLILVHGAKEDGERMEEEVTVGEGIVSAACVSAVSRKEDGAGTPKGGVVSDGSGVVNVTGEGISAGREGGGGTQADDQREEAGHMQISGLQANLVREKELKCELAVKKKVRTVDKEVEETGMEVAEGEGPQEEINPVTAGLEISDWSAGVDMEESGSLPPGQSIIESGCKRARTEVTALLGIISSSDEGETPDSQIVLARRGRVGENKGGGVEEME